MKVARTRPNFYYWIGSNAEHYFRAKQRAGRTLEEAPKPDSPLRARAHLGEEIEVAYADHRFETETLTSGT